MCRDNGDISQPMNEMNEQIHTQDVLFPGKLIKKAQTGLVETSVL